MNKRNILRLLLVLPVLAGVAWFLYQRHGASNQAATASNQATAAQEASALVKTEPLQSRVVTDTLTVYGDVMTGKVESISFPRAGQVSHLLVTQGQRVKQGAPLATLA